MFKNSLRDVLRKCAPNWIYSEESLDWDSDYFEYLNMYQKDAALSVRDYLCDESGDREYAFIKTYHIDPDSKVERITFSGNMFIIKGVKTLDGLFRIVTSDTVIGRERTKFPERARTEYKVETGIAEFDENFEVYAKNLSDKETILSEGTLELYIWLNERFHDFELCVNDSELYLLIPSKKSLFDEVETSKKEMSEQLHKLDELFKIMQMIAESVVVKC